MTGSPDRRDQPGRVDWAGRTRRTGRAERTQRAGRAGRTRRAGATGDRGQATVELALVLPLVAVLLLMLIQAAVVARDQVLVAHAAREGARAAAVDADVDAVRRAAEQAGPLAPDRLTVDVTGRGEVGSRVRVAVSYTLPTRLPLVGRALGDVTLRAAATMRVER